MRGYLVPIEILGGLGHRLVLVGEVFRGEDLLRRRFGDEKLSSSFGHKRS
jgi:hypothetical protein